MLDVVVSHLNLLPFFGLELFEKGFQLFHEILFWALVFYQYFIFLTKYALEVLVKVHFFEISFFVFDFSFAALSI